MHDDEELAIRKVFLECGTGGGFVATLAAATEQLSGSAGSRPEAHGCTDINTADPSLLLSINGIGPAKSLAILDYIRTNGPLAALDGVINVGGVGRAILENTRAAGFCVTQEFPPGDATSAPGAPDWEAPKARTTSQQGTNINAVGSAGLQRVPGIVAKKASPILEYRDKFGPCRALGEPTRVSSIAEVTLRNVHPTGSCIAVKPGIEAIVHLGSAQRDRWCLMGPGQQDMVPWEPKTGHSSNHSSEAWRAESGLTQPRNWLVILVGTPRNTYRIISMRKANERERVLYARRLGS